MNHDSIISTHSITTGNRDEQLITETARGVRQVMEMPTSVRAITLLNVTLRLLAATDGVLSRSFADGTTRILARTGRLDLPRFVSDDSIVQPGPDRHDVSERMASDGSRWIVANTALADSADLLVMHVLLGGERASIPPAVAMVAMILLQVVGDAALLAPIPLQHAINKLSKEHLQTLQLLAAGRSEKQIATASGKSRHTIHSHIRRVYEVIQVSSRAELLARLMESNKQSIEQDQSAFTV